MRLFLANWRNCVKLFGTVVIAVLMVGVAVLASHWPFTKKKIAESLNKTFHGQTEIQSFRPTYFPHPGCVAENVAVRGRDVSGAPLLITASRVTMAGSYSDFFRRSKRIELLQADTLRVHLVRIRTAHDDVHDNSIMDSLEIGNLRTPGARLEILRRNGAAVMIAVRDLDIQNVNGMNASKFHVVVEIPKLGGLVEANGQFGPVTKETGKSPLSGDFKLQGGELQFLQGVAGKVDSVGNFRGLLEDLSVDGAVESPNFEAAHAGHPIKVQANFQAHVNATNGNVALDRVDTTFLGSTLNAKGIIAGTPKNSAAKTANISIDSDTGRIQDLLWMFTKGLLPAMNGRVTFRGRALLPPEHRKFIERVQFEAQFGIGSSTFNNPMTQHNVDKLSERARGETNRDDDPQRVISNLRGRVLLRNGVATFTNLTFDVPGASADLHGTYSLLSKRVDLRGMLAMKSELSEATKGLKSFFLEALDPFFKRKHAGAVVPVAITGFYPHPKFSVSLKKKK